MKLFIVLCLVAFVAVTSAAPAEEENTEIERLVEDLVEALHHQKADETEQLTTKYGRRRRRRRAGK